MSVVLNQMCLLLVVTVIVMGQKGEREADRRQSSDYIREDGRITHFELDTDRGEIEN